MNKNPTDKDADKNLSDCINPKKTKDEEYWDNQEMIEKEIFGR